MILNLILFHLACLSQQFNSSASVFFLNNDLLHLPLGLGDHLGCLLHDVPHHPLLALIALLAGAAAQAVVEAEGREVGRLLGVCVEPSRQGAGPSAGGGAGAGDEAGALVLGHPGHGGHAAEGATKEEASDNGVGDEVVKTVLQECQHFGEDVIC